MRTRQLTAALLALACAAGLTACRSNVGVAARVNGHTISEADVAKYLTPAGMPLAAGQDKAGQSISVSQRLAILDILIKIKIIDDVLAHTSYGRPTEAQLSAAADSWLKSQGADLAAVQDSIVKNGFDRDFAAVYAREQGLEQVLSGLQQSTPDLQATITAETHSVSVNPRYGTWDATNGGLVNAPTPAYLDRQPDYVPPKGVLDLTTTSN